MGAKKLKADFYQLETELTNDVDLYIVSVHVTNWLESYGKSVIKDLRAHIAGQPVFPELQRHLDNLDATYGPELLKNYITTVWG